jgi:hypothetical protein
MVLVGITRRSVVGVVAGVRTLVIPGNGVGIGLARTGRRTIIMAYGVRLEHGAAHTLYGEAPMFPIAATVTGARWSIPTQNGEVRPVGGVIPS